MSEKPLHVIVVGAGLAGLVIAHGLNKRNISYSLYDRESTPRDRSWGITLSWALPLLEQLLPADLFSEIKVCQPDPTLDSKDAGKAGILIRDGSTGLPKAQATFPVIRRVNIQKTKKHLAQGLDVQYGKKLLDISVEGDMVIAYFDDGSKETGNVIIGADGGNSQVRKWLLGDAAAQEVLPYAFMNFAFSLPADKAKWADSVMNPNVDVATHPKNMYLGLFLLDKPDINKPETWIFYFLVTWNIETKEDEENTPNRLERLRAHMDGWADPYKSIVEWLADDVVIKPDQLRIWQPTPWDNKEGKVTLAGDAAHSMTFHRGQGGNLAIKDAFEFVQKITAISKGEVSQSDALEEYDKGVVLRGEEVAISKAQAAAFHDYVNFDNSPFVKMGIKPAGST
ncbi:putative monooxygenase [Microthyrium microscopicum]|uniref:Putative monooxygenase n=1 Tax=Microthyrium microscopicum TaxID=703497 RepID=A0A6A6U0B1_9PEZI|nr:putative monooxygenase [Microthyrium microscopicum]